MFPRATPPEHALVHLRANYPGATLELRDFVDAGPFVRACSAPCDIQLVVAGREARVVAPGMTTSNVFRFDAGQGTAGLRVDGGSAKARIGGIIALAAGIPIALAGMGLLAYGSVQDDDTLRVLGITGLAVGGVSVSISLPLLLLGSTNVKNKNGSVIALGGALAQPRPAELLH